MQETMTALDCTHRLLPRAERGPTGAIESLVLHQNGANQPARKAVGARNDLVLLAVE